MNSELFDLYKQLLKLEIDARRSVYERINHDDLCVYAHHCGRLYNNGLMIYGQAMNGWENDCDTVDGLVENILKKAEDYKVLFTVADYAGGPYKNKDGEDKIYHYKRSKFWKLNYQIITDCQSASFDKFYIPRTTEEKKDELLENA